MDFAFALIYLILFCCCCGCCWKEGAGESEGRSVQPLHNSNYIRALALNMAKDRHHHIQANQFTVVVVFCAVYFT